MKYFHNILSLLFILFFSEVLSQKITLVDSTSGRPIRGVLVFDSDRTTRAVSNRNGLVNLNNFKDSDSIFFTHIVYERKTLLYNSLKEGDNIILSPKALGLNEVVLSVSRNMQNVMTLSRKVSVINRSSTNLDIPRNTAEMLYHGGGIHVQKSQSGGGSPVIRGFEANRVLLVVDGVRMNNAIYRSGHVHNAISIDANSLERTEVIFGPSSVGYGSDALGGVIHFYTKPPKLDKDEFLDYYSERISSLSKIRESDKFTLIANTYLSLLDPHASYFSQRDLENWNLRMNLSFEGIGAILSYENEKAKIQNI